MCDLSNGDIGDDLSNLRAISAKRNSFRPIYRKIKHSFITLKLIAAGLKRSTIIYELLTVMKARDWMQKTKIKTKKLSADTKIR